MNDQKLRATDLNLLVTLVALLEAENVSRAAEQLGLSQPAASHALNRLRDTFDDPLLVRSGRRMVPTPRAEALLPRIKAILEDIQGVLSTAHVFEAAETRRTFVVATNGYSGQLLIPKLTARLLQAAPNANLRVIHVGHNNLRELLADGEVDLILYSGQIDMMPESLMVRALFEDGFMCCARPGHPLASGTMSVEDFAAADHILVSPRGDTHGAVDAALAVLGLRRRVRLVLPDFMSVGRILQNSDYVITTPASIGRLLSRNDALAQFQPPTELNFVVGSQVVLWHERVQHDPVNQWLRRLLFDIAAEGDDCFTVTPPPAR